MDLKKVKTSDLLSELANRPRVKKASAGTFANYELRQKYGGDRKSIDADVVLVIQSLDHLDA